MPSRTTNLNKANAVREAGYLTRIHSHPEFKRWFDGAYTSGEHTITSLRREAQELFPHFEVPSVNRLKSYADRYLMVKTYTPHPEYARLILAYDAYVEQHHLCMRLKALFEETADRYDHGYGRLPAVLRAAAVYGKANQTLFNMEVELGLRNFVLNSILLQLNFEIRQRSPLVLHLSDADQHELIKLCRRVIDSRKYGRYL